MDELALLKEGRYENNETEDAAFNQIVKYEDQKIMENGFNSYDSLDKYALVVDFNPSIDNKVLFGLDKGNVSGFSYNILSDAGCIPHFASKSLVMHRGDDSEWGTSFTWRNAYLKEKNHLTFELLGLDDKEIPEAYDAMEKMQVEDLTDNCKTLVNPSRLAEDIYRVWCDTIRVKSPDGKGMYFPNEYKEYSNGTMVFDGDGVAVWEITDDLFEIDLPSDSPESEDSDYE